MPQMFPMYWSVLFVMFNVVSLVIFFSTIQTFVPLELCVKESSCNFRDKNWL